MSLRVVVREGFKGDLGFFSIPLDRTLSQPGTGGTSESNGFLADGRSAFLAGGTRLFWEAL